MLGLDSVSLHQVSRWHPSPLCHPFVTRLPRELVRSSQMDITLDVDLTILDEDYNNVKALDALNQKLFQAAYGLKRDGIRLGSVLIQTPADTHSIIPWMFSPDYVAELKCDHFYSGLLKWFKAMVAYLKASANEKMYSDYLQAAREAEEEEVMEPLNSSQLINQANPRMSFFPLQKLKGTQPTKTPALRCSAFGRRGFWWRSWWNWWCDGGVYSIPCQSS